MQRIKYFVIETHNKDTASVFVVSGSKRFSTQNTMQFLIDREALRVLGKELIAEAEYMEGLPEVSAPFRHTIAEGAVDHDP